MARVARAEVFSPDEIAVVHCIARVVRRCSLLGSDPLSGRNYDHRKAWVEDLLKRFSSCFGIDLIAYAILSNHFHLVLRSRPDIVESWSNEEVAYRWLKICPKHQSTTNSTDSPTPQEVQALMADETKLNELRSRLSDISWWMRLLCQRIGIRANLEDDQTGHFFEGRFKGIRLLDEEAVLACAAYVDLNVIRAAIAQTLEQSEYTSIKKRIESVFHCSVVDEHMTRVGRRPDSFLAPVFCDEAALPPENRTNGTLSRASNKGFTWLSEHDYLEFLDGVARIVCPRKAGSTPANIPPVFERLKLDRNYWAELIDTFGERFSVVAGRAETVFGYRSLRTHRRFYLKRPRETKGKSKVVLTNSRTKPVPP